MKLLIISLLVIYSLADTCEEEEFEPIEQFYHRDIGIKKAAEIKQAEMKSLKKKHACRNKLSARYPYENYAYYGGLLITLQGLNQSSVCGSVLITFSALLTAAQCWFDGMYQAVHFEVVLGTPTLYYDGVRIVTDKVTVNPAFDNTTHKSDIAVIQVPYLPHLFVTNPPANIVPVSLPFEDFISDEHLVGVVVETVGYSLIGKAELHTLVGAPLSVITNKECAKTYGTKIVTDEVICARAITLGGPCKGEYGTPINIDLFGSMIVIGINSFITRRGCEAWPPVGFIKVEPHKKWIEDLIKDFH